MPVSSSEAAKRAAVDLSAAHGKKLGFLGVFLCSFSTDIGIIEIMKISTQMNSLLAGVSNYVLLACVRLLAMSAVLCALVRREQNRVWVSGIVRAFEGG